MPTLTANAGQFSEPIEVSAQALLVATLGYVQYTTASLVEAEQGRVAWTTWPVGASAGSGYSLSPIVVRLAGLSNGAECVITDPRPLMAADAFARSDIVSPALIWAIEDGTLYFADNVAAGVYNA